MQSKLINKLAMVASTWRQWSKYLLSFTTVVISSFWFEYAYADGADDKTIGGMAIRITDSFEGIAKLITAGAYVAGIGFALTSILKFKAHKDNPTQIPIGTPIALMFVSAALLFLPTLFGIAGNTIFGTTSGMGGVHGTTGF